MYDVTVKVSGKLVDFLPRGERTDVLRQRFGKRRSAKDLLEALGIPHTEIDRIRVDGREVDFSYIVRDGDCLEVTEVAKFAKSGSGATLQPGVSGTPQFVCDVHLQKLARLLRLLGFDVHFDRALTDAGLAEIADSQNRILLTRDRRLLMRRRVRLGMHIWYDEPDDQVIEVLEKIRDFALPEPFGRCTVCNGCLHEIQPGTDAYREAVAEAPPRVRQWRTEFQRCESCGKLYWKGTHYEKLRTKVERYRRRFHGLA